jgi:hypothetical protein
MFNGSFNNNLGFVKVIVKLFCCIGDAMVINIMECRVMVREVLVSKDSISLVNLVMYRKILAEMYYLLLLLSGEKIFVWFVLFLLECLMFL